MYLNRNLTHEAVVLMLYLALGDDETIGTCTALRASLAPTSSFRVEVMQLSSLHRHFNAITH